MVAFLLSSFQMFKPTLKRGPTWALGPLGPEFRSEEVKVSSGILEGTTSGWCLVDLSPEGLPAGSPLKVNPKKEVAETIVNSG